VKKYVPAVLVIFLFVATVITLSLNQVDYLEPNVLLYFQHLPLVYHVTVVASIIVAFRSSHKITRIISVVVLGLLVIWTPSVMLSQPFDLDSYPFVAEPVYVARSGHLANLHYLSENPALGLTFGPFLLITGMNPIDFLKVYSAIAITLMVLLVYAIANRLKLGTTGGIVASLAFVSILWPNVFHLSRQSFSLIYYLISLLLLIQLLFSKPSRRILILLCLSVVLMVLSHPATPLFFIYNLVAVLVLGRFFGRISSNESRLIANVLMVSLSIWLFWNMLGTAPGVVYSIKDIVGGVIASLIENPSEVSGITKIFVGRTTIYSGIINLRLALTIFAYFVSFLAPIVMYRRFRDKKLLLVLTGVVWSNMSTAVPLLLAGLPYFEKPALFLLTVWGLMVALVYKENIAGNPHSKIRKLINVFFVILIITSSLLVPIIKYASVPLEYAPTVELAGQRFGESYKGNGLFIYPEDPVYLYTYVSIGLEPPRRISSLFWSYVPGEGINVTNAGAGALWISTRLMSRDAFWAYTPSLKEEVERLDISLQTRNKVYDSGWPEHIFVDTPGE